MTVDTDINVCNSRGVVTDLLTLTDPIYGFAGATFSMNMAYRYTLWRTIDTGDDRSIAWCGLNPSTADHEKLDPTVTRIVKRSRAMGFSKVWMTNLFGFRATDPRDMKKQAYPVEANPGEYWEAVAPVYEEAEIIVCCWGVHGTNHFRDAMWKIDVIDRGWSAKLRCLDRTKDGHPKHPLYIPMAKDLEDL